MQQQVFHQLLKIVLLLFCNLLTFVFLVWILNYGSWNCIFYLEIIELINYLVVLAAITKRVQIVFSSWLPVTIAAPTPVSSLVYTSTLVTAEGYIYCI